MYLYRNHFKNIYEKSSKKIEVHRVYKQTSTRCRVVNCFSLPGHFESLGTCTAVFSYTRLYNSMDANSPGLFKKNYKFK